MINELSEILITAISAVSGTGGIAGVLLWKHNKKVRKNGGESWNEMWCSLI